MDQISEIARAGMARATARAVVSADRLARSFSIGSTDDAVSAVLDLQSSIRDFEGSAKVLGVQRELDRRVLDLLA